jgi:hypothetical protein
MLLAVRLGHVGEEVERRVVVANMLEAEMMILALEAMTLRCLVDAGLVATLPGTIGDVSLRFWPRLPRLNTDAVEKLGIGTHQS